MRESTWEKIGQEVKGTKVRELLNHADLDYKVLVEPMYSASGILIPNKKVTVREDTQDVLGIVSDRYKVCQNVDALDFVDHMEGVQFEKAGSYNNGSMIWMIGRLPEVNVLGDIISPRLIFQNSHDGSSSIKTTICMLRIVCQNQFVHSFQDSPATINIRHQGDLDSKLLVARETMSEVQAYISRYNELAEKLSVDRITPETFNRLLETLFKAPENATPRTLEFIENRRVGMLSAYQADDNANFKGTKWGVVNAYTDLITHEEYARKTANWQQNRFLNSLSTAPLDGLLSMLAA